MDDAKNNDGDDDAGGNDEEKMRLAFEAFMLAGKHPARDEKNDDSSSPATSSNKGKKKKKKKKPSSGSHAAPPKPSAPSETPTSSAKTKGEKKRYHQLLCSFDDRVLRWLDLDDEMLVILQNVVSIRGRLPVEWKLLHSPPGPNTNDGDGVTEPNGGDRGDDRGGWKHHGVLGKPREMSCSTFHLRADDVQLALTNDLAQHERMLAALRSLISESAERHDGLGRMVDALWKFHWECRADRGGGGVGEGSDSEHMDEEEDDTEGMVESVTDVYRMLSAELYRKQGLVRAMLESTHDEMLGIEERRLGVPDGGAGGRRGGGTTAAGSSASGGDGRGLSSLQIARRCCESWKRTSAESCIDVVSISNLSKLRGNVMIATAG